MRPAPRTMHLCALLLVLLAAAFALAGCGPGDNTWLACVFGDQAACDALSAPPPPPPVEGPPSAPTGLTATIAAGGVLLNWNNNPETDVTGYDVYRGTYDLAHQGGVEYAAADHVTQSDDVDSTPLVDGTTYFYVVTAVDTQANESARSTPVSLVYCALGHTCNTAPGPPAAPTGLVPVLQDDSGITFDWNDNAEPDLDQYFVYKSLTPGSYGPALFFVQPSEATVSTSYGLEPFTTYFFAVTALDDDGGGLESARSNEVRVRYCPSGSDCPHPPGAVTGLRLVSRDAGGVTIAWDATPGTNVARYAVYGSNGPLALSLLGTTTRLTFRHVAPNAFFPNHYVVAAVDADGHQGARTAPLDVDWCGAANPTCSTAPSVPAAPTGLTAAPQPFAAFLDWADNNETNLAGYNVQVSFEDVSGPFETINNTLATISQYTVGGLPTTFPTWFRVTAVDTAGHESAPSAVVSVTACPAVCSPAPHALAVRRNVAAFKLVLAADVTQAGTRRLEGGQIVGTGDAVAGAFELRAAPGGLDPALRRLVAKPLPGTWKGTVDWRIDPGTHSGTTTAVGLASFADATLGKACLRLSQSFAVQQAGKRPPRLVTLGTSTLLGGTGPAPKLFGDGAYTVKPRRDGALVYRGTTDRSRTVPPGIPADCAAFETP